jgi:uncharacterized repeat protein (TIGR01451 family)
VTVHRRADLSITKRSRPHLVEAGNLIRYAITVRNHGPSEAKKAKVVDFVGDHTVFRRVIAPGGWSCSHPSPGDHGRVQCASFAFAPGEVDVIRIRVLVLSGTDPGTLVSNTARLLSPTPDPNGRNNIDTTTTRVR